MQTHSPISFPFILIYLFLFLQTLRFKSVITLNSTPTNFIFPLHSEEGAPFVFRKALRFLLICKSGLYLRALHSVHGYYTFRVSKWIWGKGMEKKGFEDGNPSPSPSGCPLFKRKRDSSQSFEALCPPS